MLKKILYYGKENNKKTVRSIIVLFLSVIFQIAPFLFIYFIDRNRADMYTENSFLMN